MELFFLAIALAMDSVALSIANGVKYSKIAILDALKISFVFAFFQALMPMIGYFLGISFINIISSFDHYIAFCILIFLGIKMIKDSKNLVVGSNLKLSFRMLVLGAIATSIDALAVGVTLSFERVNIVFSSFVIGFVCLILCFAANYVGKILGEIWEKKALMLGGIILIVIGFKILLDAIFI